MKMKAALMYGPNDIRVEEIDTVSYTHLDVYKRQTMDTPC